MENDDYSKEVASLVRAEMAKRRWSQVYLADRLGKSRGYVQTRVNGEVTFSVDDLHHIAQIFEISVTDLLPPTESLAEAS